MRRYARPYLAVHSTRIPSQSRAKAADHEPGACGRPQATSMTKRTITNHDQEPPSYQRLARRPRSRSIGAHHPRKRSPSQPSSIQHAVAEYQRIEQHRQRAGGDVAAAERALCWRTGPAGRRRAPTQSSSAASRLLILHAELEARARSRRKSRRAPATSRRTRRGRRFVMSSRHDGDEWRARRVN